MIGIILAYENDMEHSMTYTSLLEKVADARVRDYIKE